MPGEARRRHRLAATAAGLALLAGVGVAAAAVGPQWPFTAGDGAPSATACPHPAATPRPGEVRIFMQLDASRSQRDAVAAKLRDLGLDPTVVDRAEAYRLFGLVYCDEPDLVAATRPEQLPEYLVVTLADPVELDAVRQAVQPMAGVDTIVDRPSRSGREPVRDICTSGLVTSDGRRVEVFLRPDATVEQREAIAAELGSLPGVVSFAFSDHEDAYERFKRVYACAPELIEATRPDALPESFIVTVSHPAAGATVRDRVGRLPGVDPVAAR
jgi:cell division protein FtsX